MSATIHRLHRNRVATSKPVPFDEALNDLNDDEYYRYLQAHPYSLDGFDRDFLGAEAEEVEPDEVEPGKLSLLARIRRAIGRQ